MKYRYFMLPFIIIFFMILVIDYNSEIVNKVLIDSNRTINYPFFDNDNIDLYPVKESQYAGTIKLNIPYLGYPTLLLGELLNSSADDKVTVDKGRVG